MNTFNQFGQVDDDDDDDLEIPTPRPPPGYRRKKVEDLTPTDIGTIEKFKAKAREFWRLFVALDADKAFIRKQSPAIKREYADLMSRGLSIRKTVEFLTGIIDKVSGLIKSVFGGVAAGQMGQLGIIPLIPIAVIAGSLALIGKWISDAMTFRRRVAEIKRLEARGIPPAEAAAIVAKIMPKGIFAGIKGLAIPIVAILGIIIIPKLLDMKK